MNSIVCAITLKSGNMTQASVYTYSQTLKRGEYYAGMVNYVGS